MERAVTWIASLVGAALLVGLPAGYYAVEQSAVRSELRIEAEHSARLITQHINAAPDLWRFKTDSLEALLTRGAGQGVALSQRLHDNQGMLVLERVQALDEPTTAVSVPVFDTGREAGRIELQRSLRPALVGSAFVALLSSLLAGAVFVALRLLPMRALKRAERLAREQAAHTAWLEKAHQDAVAEARLKSHYLARLTHEIRAPLGGLLGMTDSLRSAPLSLTHRRQAERVRESSANLLQVVNDILDYSQLEASDSAVTQQQYDPIVLIEGVIELLTPQAEAVGLALFYELGPGLPQQVEGDPGRLRQVLYNLVGNAIKFTPHGDVKILLKWVPPAAAAQAAVHFEVRDTGVGINPKAQAHLFEPDLAGVTQADGAPQGSGLGLAISRQLVHLMGGEMGLHSQPGMGSRFWFEIPQSHSHAALRQKLPTDPSGTPLHVLVADPHKPRARGLCSRLMALEFRVNAVHTANDLRTALAKPGLRFTHVMALASMGVKPTEAPWLRWVTLHEGGQHGFDWSEDESDTVLTMPCRRDELVTVLRQAHQAAPTQPAPGLGVPATVLPEVPLVHDTRASANDTDDFDEIDTVPGHLLDPDLAPTHLASPGTAEAVAAVAAGDAPDPEPDEIVDAAAEAAPELPADVVEVVPSVHADADADDAAEARANLAPDEAAEVPLPDLSEAQAAFQREAPTVLLVESNEVSQEVGRTLLESMGCEVYVADDGHQALQRLPQGFGLILLDMQISGMDGYTTASEIRRWEAMQPNASRTPLVALTAHVVGDVRERCESAGMDAVVGKPVDRQVLRETLGRYLTELAPI